MPLLPAEPCVFPDDLLANPTSLATQDSLWWVLHTRPRAEKSLARKLLAQRTSYFLPQYEQRWSRWGRAFLAHMPLFPGYVFLYGDDDARLSALQTNHVANCLPVADQGQLYANLVDVYRLITTGAALTPESRLQPGSPVEIVRGPLTGLAGKIVRRAKKLTFIVEVRLLQQGVSVEIENWMLQPAEDRQLAGAGGLAAR